MPTINGLDLTISLDSNGVITARIAYTLQFSQEEIVAKIAVAERAVLARRYGGLDAYMAHAASAVAGMQLLASQTAGDAADQVVAVLQDATASYDSFGVAPGAASVPRSFAHSLSDQERTALLEVGREHPYALVSVLPAGIRADVQIAQVEIDVGDPAAAPSGEFEVGSVPRAVAFDGQSVWVANSGSNDVTRLHLDGSFLGTYRVGITPTAIVFEGSTSTVWVANSGETSISVLSPSGTLVIRISTAGAPNALAVSDGKVWVANAGGGVTKLDPITGANLGAFALPGRSPSAIAVDGDSVWVTDEVDATVTKVRATDGSLVGTYRVGTQPLALAFDGESMWVANSGDSTVTKLRAADGASLGSFPVGSNPAGIATANGMVWVVNSGGSTVTRLRTSDGSLDETIDVGPNPGSIAYDGQNIWVTSETRNTVASRRA